HIPAALAAAQAFGNEVRRDRGQLVIRRIKDADVVARLESHRHRRIMIKHLSTRDGDRRVPLGGGAMKRGILAGLVVWSLVLTGTASAQRPAAEHWVGTWATAPVSVPSQPGGPPPLG